MSKPIRILGVLLAVLAAPASASDWYVDAANGSNSNGGTSAADAWRTITYAVASTPSSGVQTIHIATGIYDAALGETLPIHMRPDLQLVGAPGAVKPRVDATGALAAIDFGNASVNPGPFGPQTLIQGLELLSGSVGIAIESYGATLSPTLRDLDLRNYIYGGIRIYMAGGTAGHVVLERVHMTRAPGIPGHAVGLDVNTSFSSSATIDASDCSFRKGFINVRLGDRVTATLSRCRIELSADAGLVVLNNGSLTRATLIDCSISGGDNYGVQFAVPPGTLLPAQLELRMDRCTVADNGTAGVVATIQANSTMYSEIVRCVLKNTYFDILLPAPIVRDSLIADGSFAGSNGNITGDPLFVSSDALDWRLRWDSPCTDLVADASIAAGVDLDGQPRGVDGDLDRVELSDIGAFEFRPLGLVSTGKLGSQLELDSWGPQGNASIVYWTRTGPVAPIATPFGEFDLDLAATRLFRTTTVGASSPTQIVRHIPNNPLLAGQTYAFQSLVDSPASPSGKAYTNAVAVTFVP